MRVTERVLQCSLRLTAVGDGQRIRNRNKTVTKMEGKMNYCMAEGVQESKINGVSMDTNKMYCIERYGK